jgi:hypothetical protein
VLLSVIFEVLGDLRDLTLRNPNAALASMDRAFAFADALAVALFADGVLDDRERARFAREMTELGIDGDEVLRGWSARADELATREGLARALREVREKLSDDDRAKVVAAVRKYADEGSGCAVDADYRGGRRSDPAALLEAYENHFLHGSRA